jgi:hypothetical protein
VGENGLYENPLLFLLIFLISEMLIVRHTVGGKGAIMEKDESIRGMLKCLKGLKLEDSGKFFAYDGKEKAW